MRTIINFEKSCGAVIFKSVGGNIEYLCISHRNDGHWGFPKGHIEKNESEQETAVREVREETGIQITLISGFREKVEYPVKQGVIKDVIFFLAMVNNDDDVHIQLDELQDYKWANFKTAKQLLTYISSKDVLEKAYKFIASSRKL